MTAADKTNLDNTVQGLANEITNRTNAINALRTELETYVDDLIADTGSDVTALETKVIITLPINLILIQLLNSGWIG